MKPLPPTLREKRRYILFKVVSKKKLLKKDVEKALTSTVFRAIGLFGAAESSYWLVKFYEDKQIGVVRVTNQYKDKLVSALNFFTEAGGEKARLKLLKTTGTIKKAEEMINSLS